MIPDYLVEENASCRESALQNLPQIPQALREEKTPMFCLWRKELDDKDRPTKVPYRPLSPHKKASVNKETDFTTFDGALSALKNLGEYGFGGIGIRVCEGIAGIDIDHCIDDQGNLSDMAADIVETMDAYTEKSPSGKGIRIIFRVAKGFSYDRENFYIKHPSNGLEVYVAGMTLRYLTITGDVIRRHDLVERTEQVAGILPKYMVIPTQPRKATTTAGPQVTPSNLSDIDLIQKIRGSKQGQKFDALFRGEQVTGKSQSEADEALCAILAFWTQGDAEQIDRIFRMSGLYREKWNRKDYMKRTIDRAIALCGGNFYNPGRDIDQRVYGWDDDIVTDAQGPADIVDTQSVPGMKVHTTTPPAEAGADPGQAAADNQDTTKESPAPAWYAGRQNDTGIIDAVFAETFARDIGWTRTGYTLRTPAGEIVTESDALRTIVETVRQYCPLVSYQKAKRLFAMTRLYLPEDKAADELDLCTAEALDAMPLEAMVFNVNQLLPAGLTVLAAPPKTGKSWLALALADAIATGSTFFGLDTRRGACLYCALEDSRYRVQDRLRKIGSTMPPNLSIVTRGTKRLDSGLLQQLEKWITATTDARLVIIDTLARVRPLASTGLDAYNADTAAIAPLQALALAHGVSILLITHYRKTYQAAMDADPFDRITGSNGLFAVADSAWLIYGKRGGDDMTFRTTGRDATDTKLKIKFDKDSCRWQVIGTAAAVEAQKALDAYRASPLFRTIRQLVSEAGVWRGTAADLMKAIADFTGEPGGDPRTIGVDLAENAALLLKEDGIHYSKDAGGRKGRAYTFQRVKALA